MNFKLVNGLTNSVVNNANYFLYAHRSHDNEVYVGISKCPVKRWNDHEIGASDPYCSHYGCPFYRKMRETKAWTHYLLGVAQTEDEIRHMEAAAIAFYGTLNSRLEYTQKKFRFSPLNTATTQIHLGRMARNAVNHNRSDSDYEWINARIIWERNKKRVITTGNGSFAAGLMIQAGRADRDRFHVGDKVKIRGIMSSKHGSPFITVMKSATLERM